MVLVDLIASVAKDVSDFFVTVCSSVLNDVECGSSDVESCFDDVWGLLNEVEVVGFAVVTSVVVTLLAGVADVTSVEVDV